MKLITLSSNNSTIGSLLSVPNYSVDNINILSDANISQDNQSTINVLVSLFDKISLGGVMSIEIFDLKLACEYYLASSIKEQDFIKIIKQNIAHTIISIDELIVAIKDREDIVIKTIAKKEYNTKITIERVSIS
jgi:hypothetical protein